MGVNHSVQGTETVTLLNTLAVLTGNIGRPGAAPFSITGQCNAMGTRETGFTASMPGYRAYDDPVARQELAARLGIDESRLPAERGRAYPDIINAVMSGRIKGLWIIGTNPVVSFPNREVLEQSPCGQLDLLVVQDGFETPTSSLADVVLPGGDLGREGRARSPTANAGSRGCAPPCPRRARPGPTSTSCSRWPRAGGAARSSSPGGRSPRDAFDEWRRISAGRPCDYSGITWERIEAAGGVQWPCPAGDDSLPGRRHRPPVHRRALPPSGRAGCGAGRRTGADPRPRPSATSPSSSTRDAPSSTGTHVPRPGGCRSSRACRPRRGSRSIPPMPTGPRRAVGRGGAGHLPARCGGPHPGPGDADDPGGRGVHPLPLGRALRQPVDRRPVRPDLPGAQLQAVRGPGRRPAYEASDIVPKPPGNTPPSTMGRWHSTASRSGITADRRWEEQASLFERRGASGAARARRSARWRWAPRSDSGPPPKAVMAGTDRLPDRQHRHRHAVVVRRRRELGSRRGAAAHRSPPPPSTPGGPKASAAVHTHGLEVVARGRSERLAEAVEHGARRGPARRPRRRAARRRAGVPATSTGSATAGLEVIEVPIYEWQIPEDARPAIRLAEAVIAGRVHAVHVHRRAADPELAVDGGRARPRHGAARGAVGGRRGRRLRRAGVRRRRRGRRARSSRSWSSAAISRLGPLVRAVADALVAFAPRRCASGGHDLVLSGTVVRVGDWRVELTDTEARLLATLVARPWRGVGEGGPPAHRVGRGCRGHPRRRGHRRSAPPAPRCARRGDHRRSQAAATHCVDVHCVDVHCVDVHCV